MHIGTWRLEPRGISVAEVIGHLAILSLAWHMSRLELEVRVARLNIAPRQYLIYVDWQKSDVNAYDGSCRRIRGVLLNLDAQEDSWKVVLTLDPEDRPHHSRLG